VGALSYVFDEFVRLRGQPPRVDILCGTSVGAISACFLAAHMADPTLGVRRLVDLWSDLELREVFGFGARQVLRLPRVLLGGAEGAGIFDSRPMANIVHKEIGWRAVARSLRRRHLMALSVSTTEVSRGRTVVFMQTAPDWALPSHPPPRTLFRADRIGPNHALASAAIPLLFPPVRIGEELYLDGGLRQNTPMAPALRFGATHVLAVGSSREVRGEQVAEGPSVLAAAPSASFLLGKVLNAFLLDHFDADMELLGRLNTVLTDGERAFGSGFTDALSTAARHRGAAPYRRVETCTLRPSEDIGRLAGDHLSRTTFKGDPFFAKRLFSLLDLGVSTEADLASYLLFDGAFCRQLIELGRADARARRDALLAFFGDPESDTRPEQLTDRTDSEPVSS
jgi:NTE family protein